MKRRRGAALTALALALAAGCSSAGPPDALPPERAGGGVLYVALGGDDNVGNRSTFADAWPQQLFRSALSRTSTFVDLADPRSGIAAVRDEQVGAAAALHPDVVTITLLDDAERGTDPATVEEDLRAVVTRLRRRAGTTVLVGTIPRGSGDDEQTAALDAAIRRGAAAGATVVDLGHVDGADRQEAAAAIAAAFAAKLPEDARRGTAARPATAHGTERRARGARPRGPRRLGYRIEFHAVDDG